MPVRFVRNGRARRYILRVPADGSARVTIPCRGSIGEGWAFVRRHTAWIERQLQKRSEVLGEKKGWLAGTEILFRGVPVLLQTGKVGAEEFVQFADQRIRLAQAEEDLRSHVERRLRQLAVAELGPRTLELATRHQLTVHRVMVRNQRSRWGSCSVRKTISLNWRLIQTPPFVSDYIILHELMHLREMNHSRRFWLQVAQACPQWREAEAWLKQHRHLLL
ncbi:MAG TPA: SprT family zinc-dependent metalloprotease [Verrucomicrobiae bacterium]